MGPIWYYDDFDLHFQRFYLQTIFPAAICASSLAVITLKLLQRSSRKLSQASRERLVDVTEEEEEDEEEEDDDLHLGRTQTKASTYTVDKPQGEIWLVTLELAILLAQFAVSVYTVVYDRHSSRQSATLTGLAVWSYLSLLCMIRLSSTTFRSGATSLKLWNHSAILYGLEWLFEVLVFRSAIVHPRSKLSRNTIITHFALTTALALIVLFCRRGNQPVTLEYEGNIPPSREPTASVFGIITFTWVDGLIYQGFKRPLELQDVWNVAIKDKAEHVVARFRQIVKTNRLAFRLFLYLKTPILLQGAWCSMSSVFMFVPTLLLKSILEYLEDPTSIPATAAWSYVILLFFSGLLQAVGDGQAFWVGRKICINLRAVLVGEIYSKVLKRKCVAIAESEDNQPPAKPIKFWQKLRFWQRKNLKTANNTNAPNQPVHVNNGTIINLMSIDSFKVSEISAYLHFLWAATPVQLVLAITLLYWVLGSSAFVGVALFALVLPLNMYIAKSFTRAQKRIMAATDARLHATNEVLQNIRIIKYFAWESRFEATVNEKRKTEISALWKKYILWSSAATIWSGVPILITFVSFFVFTKVERRPLVPSIAFPALSMFSLLRIPLDQLADMIAHVQESKVSVDRIEAFLNEAETDKYKQCQQSRRASPHDMVIGFEQATLSWGSDLDPRAKPTADAFRIIDMDVKFPVGQLSVVAGPTGSGKTSLLMGLLGEMTLVKGLVHVPGGYSRQSLRPDPQTGLTESVAFCAQQAWLVNATIKENILFATPFDARRYDAVISACALRRDLEILDAGDQTLVGEKGITMSGGQKQRISLARALYSNSRHLMLDDCLSAVDSHTAKHIFDKVLMGPLMLYRTCILVSHNVGLTVPFASYVVVLDNGKIKCQGSPTYVIEQGALGEEMAKSVPASRIASAVPSRSPSRSPTRILEEEQSHLSGRKFSNAGTAQSITAEVKKEFFDGRIETKAVGSIKFSTIRMYLSAMGPWYYWVFAATAFIAVQLGSVATNVWIRQWANAYHTSAATASRFVTSLSSPTSHIHALSGGPHAALPMTASGRLIQDAPMVDDVDDGYYLGIYALIGLFYIIICFTREIVLFWGSRKASWTIHSRLLNAIVRATFRFFDSTPLGQLTNRFSKDIQSVDQEVAPVAIGLLHSSASVLTVIVLISVITPGFLIPGFFISLLYVATGMFYIRSSRDLKRIESVQRSPLFQHFGETLSGVVTIRAYGDESRFVCDSHDKVNTQNRANLHLSAANRWLAMRVDTAGALVSFFSAVFVVLNVNKIDAGTAGLSLSYAITFTQNVLWLVRLYAANEQNMNAVERVQEYIEVEQEAASEVPDAKPDSNWPSKGAVEFVEYTTRYRSDLEQVLKKVSFKTGAGEKVGIVGRTGAGKSSLALALFRGLEAEDGQILIDGVDIGLIGLRDLREAITIVPQDPTLFSGTLRSNLDPFGLFTDEDIFTALRRVQLISSKAYSGESGTHSSSSSTEQTLTEVNTTAGSSSGEQSRDSTVSSNPTLVRSQSNARENRNIFYDLSTQIAESGSNLSQGQRQLLCLARALLKSPKVLVMDEATASIDYATDARVQDTLRELTENTIITIAHRLQTIIDYDKVLVLDKGEVVEYAHPWELIRKEDGWFRTMCETSGEMDVLLELAKKAWDSKILVDV